jgi:hypothetical protein
MDDWDVIELPETIKNPYLPQDEKVQGSQQKDKK